VTPKTNKQHEATHATAAPQSASKAAAPEASVAAASSNDYPVQSATSGHGTSFWNKPTTLVGALVVLLSLAFAMSTQVRFGGTRRSR
jgi:hypothetical protein